MPNVLDQFSNETATWFRDAVGRPTEAQALAWPAIASGANVLVSAPTGTGKTLSAFLVFVDRLSALARKNELKEQTYVLYISPLKSLAGDIRENLRRPIEGIPCPAVTTALRTGDTTAQERRAMIKRPPHILITTPESLYLLLTSESGRGILRSVKSVIVDELHAMIDTKRGAHLMLSLARLDALIGGRVQRIALSATIRPLDRAARYLSGDEPVEVVAPKITKPRDILVKTAVPDMRVLPESTIWPALARAVLDACQGARTVIAFVEGRAQAEKLAHGVNDIAGAGFARTHHGSLSKERRLEAEAELRAGTLRLLCATSSMELGIDVGEVDRVVQVGCPFTVASALQRLGRAGHNPGRVSVMHMFPRMTGEILPSALTATAAMNGDIEPSHPPANCLDIVSQHVVAMAAVGTHTVSELLDIIRSADSFRSITEDELERVLSMLAGDYEHERDVPVRPRILYDRLSGTVSGDRYTRMLALASGGTIPDRGMFPVVLPDGTRLGELEEEFVFEARIGDKFLLGAFAWRIAEFHKDKVVVQSATLEGAQVPFWKGDGRGRAYEMALLFGRELRAINEAYARRALPERLAALNMSASAAENAARHIVQQIGATGYLPDDRTIIVEHFSDEAGDHQMMVHSIFGRRVNAALEMLVRRAAARATGLDVKSYSDDDGFLLYVMGSVPLPGGLLFAVDPDSAESDVRAILPSTPLFTLSFRYSAGRALMMGVRQGKRLPLWVQRMRGAEALSGAIDHAGHPLIAETMRECAEDYLDLVATTEVLRAIRSGAIQVVELSTNAPSPMALPLRRQVEAELIYEYSPIPTKAVRASEAMQADGPPIAPEPAAIEDAMKRPAPPDAERLHAMLMAEGDMLAGEIDAPVEFIESLAQKARALYIEPGLWIAAEHRALYASAIEDGDVDARKRIVRRCLRYRGMQSAASLAERYLFDEADCQALLDALTEEKALVTANGMYCHAAVYDRAVRKTIALNRARIATCTPEHFAAFLAERTRLRASPQRQIERAINDLIDRPLPVEAWEGYILPARVDNYRPRMLDELLARGEVYYRMTTDARTTLSFHRYEDAEADDAPEPAALTDDERAVVGALRRRGASFAHALTGLVGSGGLGPVLMSLMERGVLHADSFAPVRLWLGEGKSQSIKRRVRAEVHAKGAGRWSLVEASGALSAKRLIERGFDQAGVLSRETYGGAWGEALALLRVMEYTGQVRRGYFVRGLSGAQFVRAAEFERIAYALAAPAEEVIWLNAADPNQALGRYLAHAPERAFMLVPGTAVALKRGEAVAVLERGGEALRLFDEARAEEALTAFAAQYAAGRIFKSYDRITVKRYPDGARGALERAGFMREMLDYVLFPG